MTQFTRPGVAGARVEAPAPLTPSPTLARVAGALALGHVVLLFAGFSQGVSVEHGDSPATVQRVYGGANLTRVFTGGYVEALSFVVLAAAVVLIARLFGRRTEAGHVAAQTFLALGVALVASTLAVGFPPGAAALYGSQHGADIGSVAMVNDIRNFGFVLQVALMAAMSLALGIAALAEQLCTRWVGVFGIVLGGVGIVLVPLAHNVVSLVWILWWVGLAVLLLRGRRTARQIS
ncbi:MAG TPA: hypothetical protein VMT69_14085 [Kineosporiaceae bacterium]|nr:hypothetical protein [Kineosporiaceae bacterium]